MPGAWEELNRRYSDADTGDRVLMVMMVVTVTVGRAASSPWISIRAHPFNPTNSGGILQVLKTGITNPFQQIRENLSLKRFAHAHPAGN